MANPQKENGYVPIANELMAALCRLNISGPEFMIALTVISKTYGWNKKDDKISLTQFQKITLMSRPRVVRAIKNLVTQGVLGSYAGDTSSSSTYWIIKDYEKWVSQNAHLPSNAFVTRPSNAGAEDLVTPALHTKDTIQKTNKENASRFESLWLRYPKPRGKKAALRHFNASVKTDQDWLNINKALDNYCASDTVTRGFIQNGSTWFNDWESWLVAEKPKEENKHFR